MFLLTDSEKYREGKVEKNPVKKGVKRSWNLKKKAVNYKFGVPFA